MAAIFRNLELDGMALIRMESPSLHLDLAPAVGGRIVSLVHVPTGHEFLWRNRDLRLERLEPGAEYDPNFYGGIDELLPNDLPEEIDGIDCPDHGELWTLPLEPRIEDDAVVLTGRLPRTGLDYERRVRLHPSEPRVGLEYRIRNPTPRARRFLWKLHAAVAIEAGDRIECPAHLARVADPAWTRWPGIGEFAWPDTGRGRADIVPAADGTTDFLYLHGLREGRIAWVRPGSGLKFVYRFDPRVFPYAWLFASYGGFLGHYMAVLEPCTAMPISVNDAARLGQCAVLAPGESIETRVAICAGPVDAGEDFVP